MWRDRQGRWYGYSMLLAVILAIVVGVGLTKWWFPRHDTKKIYVQSDQFEPEIGVTYALAHFQVVDGVLSPEDTFTTSTLRVTLRVPQPEFKYLSFYPTKDFPNTDVAWVSNDVLGPNKLVWIQDNDGHIVLLINAASRRPLNGPPDQTLVQLCTFTE